MTRAPGVANRYPPVNSSGRTVTVVPIPRSNCSPWNTNTRCPDSRNLEARTPAKMFRGSTTSPPPPNTRPEAEPRMALKLSDAENLVDPRSAKPRTLIGFCEDVVGRRVWAGEGEATHAIIAAASHTDTTHRGTEAPK